jgi:Haem-binding uptake, Tiki superfamily, ChaN
MTASISGATAAFHAYEARYARRVRSFLRESSYRELLEAASAADLIYVGDYHTLKQAQRSFLKLVQRRASRRPLLLALEFVQGRHQRTLDEHLAGRLTDARFLEAIEYRRHQPFDVWPNFKPILDEARRRRLPVVGIDLIGARGISLAERDTYAARRIAAAVRRQPAAQLFALAGQLHVAPQHLPAAVDRALGRRGAGRGERGKLVVYQNCESIWFDLQDKGRELDVEAVLVRPGEFCLLNTPPVVVQQSFLDWIDGGQSLTDGGPPETRFKMLARSIARFLGLDGSALRRALDQIAVYTAGDLSFLPGLRARGFSTREIRQIEQQILSRESYFIPRARIAYLANLSVNHAAEEATHFLRHVVSGAIEVPRGIVDSFYVRTLEEAYAFYGSKIVNPRRKCPLEPEMLELTRAGDAFTREVAQLVLRHKRFERGEVRPATLRAVYRSAGPALFNAVTHSLGTMLGERLYHALATGRFLKAEARELFLDPLEEEGAACLVYLDLARRLREVRIPRRN